MNWSASKAITAARLNQYIGNDGSLPGNLNYLLDNRPNYITARDNGANYSTSSATFVDIDATNLKKAITLNGSRALLHFHGVFDNGGGSFAKLDFTVNGTRVGAAGADGLGVMTISGLVSMTWIATGLTPGSNTFSVVWLSVSGTATRLYAGNGVGGQDYLPVFFAEEIG
jgi:hypothetical protein